MYDHYWDAVEEHGDIILGLYKRYEAKKPVMLLDGTIEFSSDTSRNLFPNF